MSLEGHFLVSSPHLADVNFYRSVVLMVQHDDEGALGLVLNRPLSMTVAELWKAACHEEISSDRPVYVGGPVAGPLMCVHSSFQFAEHQICPGVYFASSRSQIEGIIAEEKPWFLFSGYSGWGPGQLENELRLGGWLTIEATSQDVFSDPADLWQRLVRQIGEEIIAPAVGRKMPPPDVSCN